MAQSMRGGAEHSSCVKAIVHLSHIGMATLVDRLRGHKVAVKVITPKWASQEEMDSVIQDFKNECALMRCTSDPVRLFWRPLIITRL